MSLFDTGDGARRDVEADVAAGGSSGAHAAKRRRRYRRLRGRLAAAVAACFLLSWAGPLSAQTGDADSAPVPAEEEVQRRWWNGWSVPSDQHRLYLGLWSAHTFESDFPDFFSNRGLGVQYRSLFAVSFVNSYGERSLAAGAERAWAQWDAGPLDATLGFRAGLIYGYDEKLLDVAGVIPILPLLQPMAMLRLGPFVADVGWVPRVMSVSGSLVF